VSLADDVRAHFPALARIEGGHVAAYLDGPGGSQAPESVIEAMADHLRRGTANDGGAFTTSLATIALVDEARRAAADLVNCAPEEIAFGWNMTTLNFQLAHAVARTMSPGDEVIVTDLDHDANVSPWLRVAEDHGLTIRVAPLGPDATLDVDALEALIGERTRVVAFTLASNAVGSIPDAARIAAAARRAGALSWADAVHFTPHRRPDRAALGIDVLLCSPYKFFGPHLGIAAIRRDLAETWPADRVRPASEDPPGHRFETGTPSFEALAGMVAAVDYLAALGSGADRRAQLADAYGRIRAHEDALSVLVLDRLAAIDGVTLHGPRRHAARRRAHAHLLLHRRRRRAARGERAAGRAGDLHVGRQLLRPVAHAVARPRGARRRRPRGLPALQQRGGGRAPLRCGGGHRRRPAAAPARGARARRGARVGRWPPPPSRLRVCAGPRRSPRR
jgi:cysteine desulfurase family protein (TIGR01976 family)